MWDQATGVPIAHHSALRHGLGWLPRQGPSPLPDPVAPQQECRATSSITHLLRRKISEARTGSSSRRLGAMASPCGGRRVSGWAGGAPIALFLIWHCRPTDLEDSGPGAIHAQLAAFCQS